MTVSDDRLGLADPLDTAPPGRHALGGGPAGVPAQRTGRRGTPLAPPAALNDLPRFLRAATALADADDLDGARVGCDVAIEAATRWQSPSALAAGHSLRASVARRAGDLRTAEQDGRTADRLFAAAGADPRGEAVLVLLARRLAVLLDRGDVAVADDLLAGAPADLPESGGELALRYVRGRLHAAAGRPGEGVADLFHCGERLASRGEDRPSVLPWRSAAARVLASIGTTEAATRLVEAEVAQLRRGGPASALGRALRVQGAIVGGPAGIALLAEAVKVLERSPRRFEHAQALVDLGDLLNAARRRPQARRVLREGLELAERCGSPELTRRAQERYLASGGRPRPPAG